MQTHLRKSLSQIGSVDLSDVMMISLHHSSRELGEFISPRSPCRMWTVAWWWVAWLCMWTV